MSSKEDEYDKVSFSTNRNTSQNSNQENYNRSNMSKAELRKSNKPIMEKRRRARINHCLNELKSLILEAMKKDPARHTKLEKADILEMTVKHLQQIQKQQLTMAIQTDPTVIHKFKSGFSECADEVNRYIGQLDGIDSDVRQRLANHLNNCTTNIDQIGTFSTFSNTYRTTGTNSNFGNFNVPLTPLNHLFNAPSQDVNNNGRLNMGGVQLIPSRLPTGEIALIMPNSSSIPSSLFMQNIQQHPESLTGPAAIQTSIDFPNSFSRISAFSKPIPNSFPAVHSNPQSQNCTKTTSTIGSPPLSPASSISSLGDESSLMHTSSDFPSTKTPPPDQQNSSGYFSTPPSSESIKIISRTAHLQQPHVSSTSENSITNRKRSHSTDMSYEEKQSKLLKIAKFENNNESSKSNASQLEESENMWRPW